MSDKGVALVTGAGGAMGSACASRLARDGYTVALMDINEAGLEASLAQAGPGARSWCVDQTDEGAVRAAVCGIEQGMGPIEALANTVGLDRGHTVRRGGLRLLAQGRRHQLHGSPVRDPSVAQRNDPPRAREDRLHHLRRREDRNRRRGRLRGAKAAECAFAKSIAAVRPLQHQRQLHRPRSDRYTADARGGGAESRDDPQNVPSWCRSAGWERRRSRPTW